MPTLTRHHTIHIVPEIKFDSAYRKSSKVSATIFSNFSLFVKTIFLRIYSMLNQTLFLAQCGWYDGALALASLSLASKLVLVNRAS